MKLLDLIPFQRQRPPLAPDEVEQFRMSLSITRIKDVGRREALAMLRTLKYLPDLPKKDCHYLVEVERMDGSTNRLTVLASDQAEALHMAFQLEWSKGYHLTRNYKVTACL